MKSPSIKTKYILLFIIALAFILRFYNIGYQGFKFTDEGYYFNPALDIDLAFKNGASNFLYYYHALMFWIYLGCKIFGFTPTGALIWAALCGVTSVFLIYLICLNFLSKKSSLLSAFAFGINYYMIYYQRSNLVVGYGIFFLLLYMLLFIIDIQLLNILPYRNKNSPLLKLVKIRYYIHFLTGVSLGILYHIRIDTGIIATGLLGATGIALALSGGFKNILERKNAILKQWLFLLTLIPVAIAAYMLFVGALWSVNWINWEQSLDFYKKHLLLANKGQLAWKPYLFINLWHLTGIPFLLISIFGLICESIRFKSINISRKWLLISFWGLAIMLIKAGIAYPRAYVYNVMFLCIYWGIGVRRIANYKLFKKDNIRYSFYFLIIITTFIGEFLLVKPLFYKRANYDKAVEFIATRGTGDIHGTHSWPLFKILPFQFKSYIVYDTYKRITNYKDFCIALKRACEEDKLYYMVLDNNITYCGGDSKLIQQFAVTVLPDAVFENEYGYDWHTSMDAFRAKPALNIFTDKIMIYDIRNLGKIPSHPIPYYDDKTMDYIFRKRWQETHGSPLFGKPFKKND